MMSSRIVISLIVGVILLGCVSINAGGAKIQVIPLFSSTFYELGYKTPITYYRGGTLTLYVNCSGAMFNLYSAKINVHFTGEDSYYTFRINMGTEISGGALPGCEFHTGWQERSIEPGYFHEGNNSLRIQVTNCPTSDQTSTIYKYLIILPDSYIEIFDGSVSESSTMTGTEPLTTETTVVFSGFSNDFLEGVILGGLTIGGILLGGFVLYSIQKERLSYGYQTIYDSNSHNTHL